MSEESIEIPWVLDPPPTLDDLPTSFSNDNNDNISVDMNAKSIKSKRKKSILLAICSITFIAIAALGASIGRRNNNNNKASSVVVSDICLKDEDVFITAADDDKSYYTTDGDTMNSNDLLASNDMFPLILSENDGPFRRRGLRRDIKNRALTMNTIRGSGTRELQECDATSPSNGVLPPQSLIQSPRFKKSAQNLRDPNFDSKRSSLEFNFNSGTIGRDEVLKPAFPISSPPGAELGLDLIFGLVEKTGAELPDWVKKVLKGALELAEGVVQVGLVAGITFDSGAFYNVDSIDNGTYVDVDSPIDINITYPGQNSFKCGEPVEIVTSLSSVVGGDSAMSVIPAFYRAAIGAFLDNVRFEVSAGLKLSGCFGIVEDDECPDFLEFDQDITLFNESIWEEGYRLNIVEFCEAAFMSIKPGEEVDDFTKKAFLVLQTCILEKVFGNDISELLLDIVEIAATSSKASRFGSFTEDKITLNPAIASSKFPELKGVFEKVDTDDLKLNNTLGVLQVSGEKQVAEASFDLLDILAYYRPGFKPTVDLFGLLTVDFGDVSPTLTTKQKLLYELVPTVEITFNLPITMAFEILDETGTKVGQGTSNVIVMQVGNTLRLTYPQELQDPVDLFNSYTVDAGLKVKVENEYISSFTVRLFELKLGNTETGITKFPPLIEEKVAPKTLGTKIIEDYTAPLGTITTSFPDESFRLDPERPILEIDLRKIHVSNLGDLMRSVTYQVDAQNEGDVDLRDLKLNLSVDTSSIGAEYFNFGSCVFSPMWNENPNFNGLDDNNTLASPGPDLTICETGFVQAEAIAKPKIPVILPDGCFDPSSTSQTVISRGFASSPIGTPVESGVNECTQTRRTEEAIVTVNIGPQPITSLQNFTLYGWDGVDLLSSMATPSIGNVGSAKDMELSLDECTVDDDDSPVELRGTLHVGHDLKVDEDVNFKVDYAQVGGSVIIGKSSKSSLEPLPLNGPPLNVLGAISEGSDCVSVFEAKSSKSSKSTSSESTSSKSSKSCAANPVTIPDDKTLRPGVYSTVTILDGGIKRLVPGNYTINKLVVYSDVQIIAMINDDDDNIVELDIKKWEFRCSLDVEWNFKSGKSSKGCKGRKSSSKSGKSSQKECSFSLSTFGGSPKQFKVNYSGKKDLRFNGALLEGTLTAPEADVSLDFGSKLRGALYAKRVFMGAGTSFVSDDEIKGSRESKCSNEPVPVQTAPWKDDE